LLVDTSVWLLAVRRNAPVSGPEVLALRAAIDGGDARALLARVQVGTIDALLGQLCIRHELTLSFHRPWAEEFW
jgi:hypothetical protein